jgi:hypothetical protein
MQYKKYHKYDPALLQEDFDRHLEFSETSKSQLENDPMTALESLATDYYVLGVYALVLGKDRRTIIDYFMDGVMCYQIMIYFFNNDGSDTVTFELEHKKYVVKRPDTDCLIDSGIFSAAWFWGVLMGDTQLKDELKKVDLDELGEKPGLQYPEYEYPHVRFLQHILTTHKDAGDLFFDYFDVLEPDSSEESDVDLMEMTEWPCANLWMEAMRGSRDQMQDLLSKANDSHVEYHQKYDKNANGEVNDIGSFFPFRTIATAAYITQQGLKFDEFSDYFPQWLIEADFSRV